MTQVKNAPKKIVPISQVVIWEKNPRVSTKAAMKRLKNQILDLGLYKPLVCCKEDGKYIVLDGNQRYQILKGLKQTHVEISLVKAETEARKIQYALSGNDLIGQTEDQLMAELIFPYVKEIPLEDYNIDRGESMKLSKMMNDFAPGGIEEQARLEKMAKKEDVATQTEKVPQNIDEKVDTINT